MRRDSRLSVALHLLLHLERAGGPLTSEALGASMDANPVVVRRTLGGLREAGIVRSEKGHGGGWTLGRDLGRVTLGDVYQALGVSPFALGVRDPHPRCGLERAANEAIDTALAEAEAVLAARLRGTTVAALAAQAARAHPAQARKAGLRCST